MPVSAVLVPLPPLAPIPEPVAVGGLGPRLEAELLTQWLQHRAHTTLRSSLAQTTRFARWLGLPASEALPGWLIAIVRAVTTEEGLDSLGALRTTGRAPATRNGWLAVLRSRGRSLRQLGSLDSAPEIDGGRGRRVPHIRGPEPALVTRLLAAAAAQADDGIVEVGADRRRMAGAQGLAAREVALIRLLREKAPRRGEVVLLALEHVVYDAAEQPTALRVRSKGHEECEALTLPRPAAEPLATGLARRGTALGSLCFSRGGRWRHVTRQRIALSGALYVPLPTPRMARPRPFTPAPCRSRGHVL